MKRKPLGSPEAWVEWLLRQAKELHMKQCEVNCRPLNHDIECTRNSFRRHDAEEILSDALATRKATSGE